MDAQGPIQAPLWHAWLRFTFRPLPGFASSKKASPRATAPRGLFGGKWLKCNLVLGDVTHVSFAVFGAFGIRKIINPAVSTANITTLSPRENEPPLWVYTYPNM
jgi:hypothetical protein